MPSPNPVPLTYSFLDVQCSINGPGGSFNLGSGSGASEEGIEIAPNTEIDHLVIGADGAGMHSLIADKSGKVTVNLLKTSPVNQQLSLMLATQRASGATWGQNTITLTNTSSGDVVTCQQAAFVKPPDLKYSKEGGMNKWEFNATIIDIGLGAGPGN